MSIVHNLQDALDEVEAFRDDAVSIIEDIIKDLNKAIYFDDVSDIIEEIEDTIYKLGEIINNLG